MIRIVQITSDETVSIRHKVMWPNHPVDYVRLPNDHEGKHYGLYVDDTLISVVSLFTSNKEAQFRKFATLNEYQRKGYGTKLLNEIMSIAEKEQLSRIWCNARTVKTNYYSKFNMRITNTEFVKGGLNYVIMERSFLI